LREIEAEELRVIREHSDARVAIDRDDPLPKDVREFATWDRRHGLAELRLRAEGLEERLARASERLSEMKPTTLAGCAAVVSMLAEEGADNLLGSTDWRAKPDFG
jgi:hypothetical protein